MNIHRLFNLQYDKTDEAKQAAVLAKIFEDSFPGNISGDIYILPEMVCPNAKNKNLDLVVWIDINDEFEIQVICGVKDKPLEKIMRKIIIKDALLIFELKKHNEYSSIKIENQKLYCLYDNDFHDVTNQSNGQKTALVNFLNKRIDRAPFVVNLIWLYRADNVGFYDAHEVYNVIWGLPSLKNIFEIVLRNNLPRKENNISYYKSSANEDIRKKTRDFFEVLRNNSAIGIGRISSYKVHELIQKDIKDFEVNYFNGIGTKLTTIHGNPGTGKTIHLIHLAKNLYRKRELKCLILTYNNSLRQDIKRLLFYSGISNADYIDILTFDAFVRKCLLDINQLPNDVDYEKWTEILYNNLIKNNQTRASFPSATHFDCVLIDEGQDWSNEKKGIIFNLFGYQYTVVAIGDNQFIENNFKQNWTSGLEREQKQTFTLEVSHRNKVNIVDFLKLLGENYDWDFISNQNLNGGRVIISTDYSYKLHKEIVDDLQKNQNSFYDMMFLGATNKTMDEIENKINSFGQKGFVANRQENRTQSFPLDQFRIISYQACRGLEAWTVVCFEWDIFIEEILSNNKMQSIQQAIESFNLVVMTRAIDTLVIILKDPQSNISKELIKIAKSNPGICRLMV
jgi:DNA replication protein DnaC